MNKPKLKINELFSGIGAQIEGLKNINVFDNKVICTSDIDKDAMLSYAIIHCGLTEKYINNRLQEDNIPFDKIADWLTQKNIGYDYKKNKPYNWYKLTKTDKSRYKLMKYYLACTLSKNMGDISLIQELPYADLWTYSFPCQDISLAGKQAGIKEGTRSGLLLEVERLLTNTISNNNAPKYLLLENVKNLVGGKHRADFDIWLNKLDELGYNTYWKVINAKNCGIPQNRERVFAISIRKDIDSGLYEFPNDMPLNIILKDMLDDIVDDKYYLNDNSICNIDKNLITKVCNKAISNHLVTPNDVIDPTYANSRLSEIQNNKIKIMNNTNNNISPTLTTRVENFGVCVGRNNTTTNYEIRKLTPKECWRLMGFTDEIFNKVESMGVSNSQLYKQAGNSIVVNCIELLMEHLYKVQYDKDYVCRDENFTIPHN